MQLKSIMGTAAVAISLLLACALSAQAAPVSGQGTWETTLLGRDINRNAVAATDASAVYLYDTALHVTWLRDANANGLMDWKFANTWAANLSTGSGANIIDDWRLPTMAANPNPNFSYNGSTSWGYNVHGSSSEMASLFFDTLGNTSWKDTNGVVRAVYGMTNTGSFQNLQSSIYWLGTVFAQNPNNAWGLGTFDGGQSAHNKLTPHYAMAVRNGDVLLAPVPEPETYAMLLAGLGVMGAVARRRKATQA